MFPRIGHQFDHGPQYLILDFQERVLAQLRSYNPPPTAINWSGGGYQGFWRLSEVIVVNGPSTDNSEAVIASWGSRIRAARCDVANISVSRNIGICMAQGDIVAFIDDDAVPEPEWLAQLLGT